MLKSRSSRFVFIIALIMFVLACNFVTQPVKDAQQAVQTVQSIATAMPLETLQSIGTEIPLQTLEALPSEMPDFQNLTDPQGTPMSEWNGVPVMPQATAGGELSGVYSYKVNATVQEVIDYYEAEMPNRGWQEGFTVPETNGTALLSYEKDSSAIVITIVLESDGVCLVSLGGQ